MANRQKKHDHFLNLLNQVKRDNDPPIERHEFTIKEIKFFTAVVGICGVCGIAALLSNAWVLVALVPVAIVVKNIGK